jgi:predicted permease
VDAIATAFNAVVPTFLLIALGALADRMFPKLHMETLTRLAVYFLIPALVFAALANTDLTLGNASRLALAYLLYLVVLAGVAWLGARDLEASETRGIVVTTLFGNTGNMGLPITLFAYGAAGLDRAVVLLVVSLVLMFAVGPSMLSGKTASVRGRILEALRLPPIWATVLGVAMNGLGWQLPVSLDRGVALLADAAIPVMLLSLGVQMRRSWVWSVSGPAMRATVLRLAVGPVVAFGAAIALALADLDRNVLILSAAMPAAVTMFVVAVEVDGDYAGVARTVVATTVGSVFAITGVLFLFPG